MRLAGMLVIVGVVALAGCGESKMLACDEGPYQVAVRAKKVEAPDGLDSLNPLNEVPLPAASPQQPRPEDGPCLEHPPQIIKIE